MYILIKKEEKKNLIDCLLKIIIEIDFIITLIVTV